MCIVLGKFWRENRARLPSAVTFQRKFRLCVFSWVSKEIPVRFDFALLWALIVLRKSRHFLSQCEEKPKSIANCTRVIFRTLHRLQVSILLVDCAMCVCCSWSQQLLWYDTQLKTALWIVLEDLYSAIDSAHLLIFLRRYKNNSRLE